MFRHLLIDEMQDTNAVQVAVLEAIAAAGPGNLTAVGDDAQSIYRFRGADYDNILKFAERHPGAGSSSSRRITGRRPRSSRSPGPRSPTTRPGFPKELVSARPDGVLPLVVAAEDAYDEAAFICEQILEQRDKGLALGQMAVLYRNHYDSILLQGELLARGIPYTVRSGLRFFEQAHIKDVLAFLRIVVNPRDEAVLAPAAAPDPRGRSRQGRRALSAPGRRAANRPRGASSRPRRWRCCPPRARASSRGSSATSASSEATNPETNPAAAIGAILKGGYPGHRPARSTSGPTTGSPTSSSSPCWPRGTTASSGSSPT